MERNTYCNNYEDKKEDDNCKASYCCCHCQDCSDWDDYYGCHRGLDIDDFEDFYEFCDYGDLW